MHFHNFDSLAPQLHAVIMELPPRGRSRVQGPVQPPGPRISPIPLIYLGDPLAPVHDLANLRMLGPVNKLVTELPTGSIFTPAFRTEVSGFALVVPPAWPAMPCAFLAFELEDP